MRSPVITACVIAASLSSSSYIFDTNARADDWGCQVILCLSNPGGQTAFPECHPPIHKLWRHLARGRSFPTCSGVGFQSSRSGYERYYCNEGYRLVGRFAGRAREVTCVSTSVQPVSNHFCSHYGDAGGAERDSVISAHWQRKNGRFQCVANVLAQPNIREKPRFIDITIDGVGKKRVWY